MRELSVTEVEDVSGGNAYTDLGAGMGGVGVGLTVVGSLAVVGVAGPGIVAIGAAWMVGGGLMAMYGAFA